ncbi:MAG TPA: hypothetical protein VGA79_11790, partial [Desulfobaccales bacterium]
QGGGAGGQPFIPQDYDAFFKPGNFFPHEGFPSLVRSRRLPDASNRNFRAEGLTFCQLSVSIYLHIFSLLLKVKIKVNINSYGL